VAETLALVQLLFRVTFGIALAMAATPPRRVTSGFFRVHLWVLMGMNTLAALVLVSWCELFEQRVPTCRACLAVAIFLALLSYAGSVVWLYERVEFGRTLLAFLAALGLVAAMLAWPWPEISGLRQTAFVLMETGLSGLVLGTALGAMFLGHWYLNTPGMQLAPLQRLLLLLAVALVARGLLAALELLIRDHLFVPYSASWLLLAVRWGAGLCLPLLLTGLAWRTLRIPNPQSATGILYATVVLTLLGELMSLVGLRLEG
jgi:hypothetical protein